MKNLAEVNFRFWKFTPGIVIFKTKIFLLTFLIYLYNYISNTAEYHPGEQLTCEIIVAPVCLWNFFKLNSISINVTCPYDSTQVPYFQLSRLASYDTSTDERIRSSSRLDTEELIGMIHESHQLLLEKKIELRFVN